MLLNGKTDLEKQSLLYMNEAVNASGNPNTPIYGLVSGGNDSSANLVVTSKHPNFSGVIHANTGIGLQSTRDHLQNVCDTLGLPLIEYHARENCKADGSPDPKRYEDLVRRIGFPTERFHTDMFSMLKERSFYRAARDVFATGLTQKVIFSTGLRLSESDRRYTNINKYGIVSSRGSIIYVNPIAHYEATDCFEVLKRHGLSRNPVKDLLGISGECLCGAYGSPAELEIATAIFPTDPTIVLLNQLNDELQEAGFPWGWGGSIPAHWGKTQRYQALKRNWQRESGLAPGEEPNFNLCGNCNKKSAGCSVPQIVDAPKFLFSSKPMSIPTTTTQDIPAVNLDQQTLLKALMGSLSFAYSIPATRGKQGGRDFYTATVPLVTVVDLFRLRDETIPPEQRAQRPLNETRGERIASYILEHQHDPAFPENRYKYVLGGLAAAIPEEQAQFVPIVEGTDIGFLKIAHGILPTLDGQHRHLGVKLALLDLAELGQESVTVTFYITSDLEEQQTIFSVLNRYASKPSTSTSIFFDHADSFSTIARSVRDQVFVFKILTELHASSIKKNSIKLFSFSALYDACHALFQGSSLSDSVQTEFAIAYWSAVSRQIPQWQQVASQEIAPAIVRDEFVHHLGITLIALGRVGNLLLDCEDWEVRLQQLQKVNWSRQNPDWDGVLLQQGTVIKQKQKAIAALTSYLKTTVGLEDAPIKGGRKRKGKTTAVATQLFLLKDSTPPT
jgi:DNA sulfur modification protein DndB